MFPKNNATGTNHWNEVYSGESQKPQPTKSSKSPTKTAPTSATTNTTKKTAHSVEKKADDKSKVQKMSINITKADLERIPESINFPGEEEKVLQYWKDEQVFENCLKQSKGKPR